MKPSSAGTGSFVSTTVEKGNRYILTFPSFLPPPKNYTQVEIDNIDQWDTVEYIKDGEKVDGPLPPPESLPDPIIST